MYTAQGKLSTSEIVSVYTPIVRKIALQCIGRLPACVDLDDLIQAGMIGLLDATQRYKEEPNTQFETYAAQRIRGAMLDELRDSDWAPRRLRQSSRHLETAVHKVEQKLGRTATEHEIAQEMNLPLAKYQALLQDLQGSQLIYYEDFSPADSEGSFLDNYCSDPHDPLSTLLDESLFAALTDAIRKLPERERLLMSLYYERGLNLREIGHLLELTESRVSQIHSQVIVRLRQRLRQMV